MSDHAKENALGWWNTIVELVGQLDHSEWHECTNCTDAAKCRDQAMCDLGDPGMEEEAAQTRIRESVLSVRVRDGWHNPSDTMVDASPEEYEILLATGGPALRIYGHLDRGEPDQDPMLQWQDWGTPWTDWWPPDAQKNIPYKDTLRTFASQFYFGDG